LKGEKPAGKIFIMLGSARLKCSGKE